MRKADFSARSSKESYLNTMTEHRSIKSAFRAKMAVLSLAELDFLHLQRFSLTPNDGFSASIALAHWLFKILALLYRRNDTSRLYLTVKTSKQVFY
jgi:hypothetical protein